MPSFSAVKVTNEISRNLHYTEAVTEISENPGEQKQSG